MKLNIPVRVAGLIVLISLVAAVEGDEDNRKLQKKYAQREDVIAEVRAEVLAMKEDYDREDGEGEDENDGEEEEEEGEEGDEGDEDQSGDDNEEDDENDGETPTSKLYDALENHKDLLDYETDDLCNNKYVIPGQACLQRRNAFILPKHGIQDLQRRPRQQAEYVPVHGRLGPLMHKLASSLSRMVRSLSRPISQTGEARFVPWGWR